MMGEIVVHHPLYRKEHIKTRGDGILVPTSDDLRARRDAFSIADQLKEIGCSVRPLDHLTRKADSRNFAPEMRRTIGNVLRGKLQAV